ncbi:MAG TPA: FliI/YscN family ATPase [Ramlibacter sp.]|nr:FliI/YscN family ATPase [Ramlibacter sp.]
MSVLARARESLRTQSLCHRIGQVRRVRGLAIDTDGPEAGMGELCSIRIGPHAQPQVLAQVVALHGHQLTLVPFGDVDGVRAGAEVLALGLRGGPAPGPHLLGRVLDAFGAQLDGGSLCALQQHAGASPASNPLQRPRIREVLETGIRVVDALLTLGRGQRVGIFAGSGVGKSTLLGTIARHVGADLNVIALVGERSREVREFLETQLGARGLARSVVVVATAEQPAAARVRAAHTAAALAHAFAAEGRHVLLTMDSITRLAMARRELGLAAGEPATARGYTPSVFAELPGLCERCGTTAAGGSVTALMTVLVEGDDLQEPIADALRSLLDGHVVLSRELAEQGHHPAIDVLRSTSRLFPELATAQEKALAASAVRYLALLQRHRPMVDLGAYQAGSHAALDRALAIEPQLTAWMRQAAGGVSRDAALRELGELLATEATT